MGAALTALCADLAMVAHHAPEYVAAHPGETLTTALLQGVAESMSPTILGFTVLTLVALFIALGHYRQSLQA